MHQDRDDQDRVVSRRVDHPAEASASDESAYRAADPLPDEAEDADATRSGSGEASATEAAAETAAESDEPTRSE